MSGDDVTQHTHCWHVETTVLLTYPAQLTEVCCHCGQRQARTAAISVLEHGPHFPTKSVVIQPMPRQE